MARTLTIAAALVALPLVALSGDAAMLVREEIAGACSGQSGEIDPAAIIERDLTGDGDPDLIIAHEGIRCADGRRSNACGMQLCSFVIYVSDGGLLRPAAHMLGSEISVSQGEPPEIRWYGHNGVPHSATWIGSDFR